MKKPLKIIGISILALLLFRGFFYRLLIKYNEIGTRAEIEIINGDLIERIESKSSNRKIDLKEIAEIADEITNEELSFATNLVSNDPNELIHLNRANCIGYSSMFNAIANYLIRKNNLQKVLESRHLIGQLHFLGINIHPFFDSPFFSDHDFNVLKNKKTGQEISIDPSISDYLWIKRVAKNQ